MFLTLGGTTGKTGSRADKERESYQKRTAPTETECKQYCSKEIEVPILYVSLTAGRGATEGEPDSQMRKETELAETQQELREKVNSDNYTVCCVL